MSDKNQALLEALRQKDVFITKWAPTDAQAMRYFISDLSDMIAAWLKSQNTPVAQAGSQAGPK